MGYAFEAANAVKEYAREVVGLTQIVAVTNPGNESSIRLLTKLGFTLERMVRLVPNEPELRLFHCTL